MSMQPRPWPEVPLLTAQAARAAFPGGSLAMRIRDELGARCEDEAFSAVYGNPGRAGAATCAAGGGDGAAVRGEPDGPAGG
jgi:hypothetical protein